MNGLNDAQLAEAGFQSRPPLAFSRASRDFRYQCGDCGLWFRTIEFSPAGMPVCAACMKEAALTGQSVRAIRDRNEAK